MANRMERKYNFLIKKREEWNKDLDSTRLIMLIEVTRKLIIKISMNRLSNISKDNNVLKGRNFAALKGESTFESIKVLQNRIEYANFKKIEAWIILMDISKAYDSVSGFFLEKGMNQMKIPEIFIFKTLTSISFWWIPIRLEIQDAYTHLNRIPLHQSNFDV